MNQPPLHDYYYGSEAEQYICYRLPKALFSNSRYKGLSDGAKILYGLLLDRMGLSMKNGWLDNYNRVFIYFTLEDVQEYMNCKQDKGVKLLAELDTVKGVGLIERVKQGQGRPTKIYVKKFYDAPEVLTSEKPKSALPLLPKSGLRKCRGLDFGKTVTNKTDGNYTDGSQNKDKKIEDTSYPINPAPPQPPPPSRSRDRPPDGMDKIDVAESYRDLIMFNIEYDILVERWGAGRMDEAV